MARVKLIQTKDDIAPEHYALFDELAALRGRISGPSSVVLYSPRLARPWNQISEYLHSASVVEPRYAELAVCATAREYDCGYIWAAHLPQARRAGISEAALAAVRDGGAIEGLAAEEAGVLRYVHQLLRLNRIDADVFDPLLRAHGPRWLVELTVWIGRYSALAGIVNAFEVTPAPDADQLPAGSGTELPRPREEGRAPLAAPRIEPITKREQMPEGDLGVFDAVAEGRGSVRGPFSLMMHSPPLCRSVLDVSNCLRFDSDLSPRLRELATISVAREKDCPYVWAAHAPAARNEGVDSAVVATIASGAGLDSLSASDRDIVEYVRQLLNAHRVDQALFERLRDQLGVPLLVETTALIGHYGVVTALLNAMEMAPAPGAEPLPRRSPA